MTMCGTDLNSSVQKKNPTGHQPTSYTLNWTPQFPENVIMFLWITGILRKLLTRLYIYLRKQSDYRESVCFNFFVSRANESPLHQFSLWLLQPIIWLEIKNSITDYKNVLQNTDVLARLLCCTLHFNYFVLHCSLLVCFLSHSNSIYIVMGS